MLVTAAASALFGPKVLAGWVAETAQTLDLKFAGTLDMLPADISASLPAHDENALGYLQFSSGSTRFPAGIATHDIGEIGEREAAFVEEALQGHDLRGVNRSPSGPWATVFRG